MMELRVLGSPALEGASPAGVELVLRRPKLLGLLSFLAMERRFVARESIMAMFWPELDEAHARASLRKAAFLLRRALGPDLLLCRGTLDLRTSPEALRCDAAEFEQAIRADRPRSALELYGGTLLPGMHLDETPEFEAWLEDRRRAIDAAAERAVLRLGRDALRAGDLQEALRWAARGREMSPRSESTLEMELAVRRALGDEAGVEESYERFVRVFRIENDVDASPRLKALLAAGRSQGPGSGAGASPNRARPRPGVQDRSAWDVDGFHRDFTERCVDLLFVADVDGYIVWANAAAKGLLGVAPAELTGTLLLDRVREDFRDTVLDAQLRLVGNRALEAYTEFPVVHPDGREVWLGQRLQLVVSPHGEVAGVQGLARDITPQMRMAEVQRRLALRDRDSDLFAPRGFHAMAEDRVKMGTRGHNVLILATFDVEVAAAVAAGAARAAMARLLEGTFRASDVVARIDEHRFAVLAMEPADRTWEGWVGSVRRRLKTTARDQAFPPELTVRVGMGYSGPARACDATGLLARCAAAPSTEERLLP